MGSVLFASELPGDHEPEAAVNRRTRAPVEAYTQQGESPCQAERSPACNRRLLRRGNTGWGAAGGEQPVRNNVTGCTGDNVNPIRPRRPASLRVLCEAQAKTQVGKTPSASGRRQGPLAGRPEQREKVNGPKCRGWGDGVVGDRRVGGVDARSRETRQGQNGVHGHKARRTAWRESERP